MTEFINIYDISEVNEIINGLFETNGGSKYVESDMEIVLVFIA